mmetsp:Transcript_12774/g.17176  ORF Transcript_12774/g.17176 Transcript_12774/m.17176 type:complete len:96 (+) Transcript_12774:86-373(+)
MAHHIKLGLVVCVALFASVALQGCGCDDETARSCIAGLTAATSGDALCTYGKSFINCFKDNGCCDWEEDGQTVASLINPISTTLTAASCSDVPSC